jgi:hypothetical protein
LCVAAARKAWLLRRASFEERRPVRFAVAIFAPTFAVLSVAATARNVYLAPALSGAALLLGWWASHLQATQDPWDARAVRATSALLLLAVIAFAAAALIVGRDSWVAMNARATFGAVSFLGLMGALLCAASAWRLAGRGLLLPALFALLLGHSALLVGPGSQIFQRVDAWQDLASIGRAIERDAAGRPVILFAPDETTRAFIDMYAQSSVALIAGPVTTASIERLRAQLAADPESLVVTQLPGRNESGTLRQLRQRLGLERLAPAPRADAAPLPAWASESQLRLAQSYALPNGRRYALLARNRT